MRNGAVLPCKVEVFPLEVERQRKRWPEMAERTTRWFGAEEAAARVVEPDLAMLIGHLAEALRQDHDHDHGKTTGSVVPAGDPAKGSIPTARIAPAP